MTKLEADTLAAKKTAEFNAPRFPEQDENGIDRSLLRANLRLTPAERVEKHQRALQVFLEVQRAGREARSARRTEKA